MGAYTCSGCGATGKVPFSIDPERPFYCRECWAKKREDPQKKKGE
jgi:CxxC-x17-CxxC domain-containing protein